MQSNSEKQLSLLVENVSLSFILYYHRQSSSRTWLVKYARRLLGRPSADETYMALKDVSLALYHGDIVGIIGPNGSGKSTLLRVISGIYQPDSGRVIHYDKISALLSLGAGFNYLLSARENVRINGLLMGLTADYIEGIIDQIIEFAEIGNFADVPLKYWSSGMVTRLSFAVTAVLEPEVLLIDEILSVGDIIFQKKATNAMEILRERAKCQVIVSHSLGFIRENCTRAICLLNGKIEWEGNPDDVVKEYESYAARQSK